MKKFISILIFLSLLGLQPSYAQIVPLQIFNTEGNSGRVNCLFQDKMGFIWIGKETGLYRYDGHELRSFKSKPNDVNSISSDNIVAINEDTLGNLWVGTRSGGLNCLDRKSGNFKRYIHDENNPNSFSFNEVCTILPDAVGNLWIGTDGGGLNFFNKTTGKFTAFKVGKKKCKNLDSNKIIHIEPAGKNKYWLGTWAGGLYLFDSVTNCFQKMGKGTNYESSNIYFIKEVKPGTLWISTDNKGLISFDIKSKTFSTVIPEGQAFFLHNIINTNKGEVYVASNRGLYYFASVTSQPRLSFEFNSIQCFFLDKTQTLWVGNSNGKVGKINSFNKQFHSISANDVLKNFVSSMFFDTISNTLYFSSQNHFVAYNPITRKANLTSLPQQFWYSFFKIRGKKDEFIVAIRSVGLRIFNYKTKSLTPLKFESNPYKNLLDSEINMISPDGSKGFWISANGAAFQINQNEKSGSWKIVKAIIRSEKGLLSDSDFPTCFQLHPNGDFFIGTQGGGLNQLTKSGKQKKYLSSATASDYKLSNDFIECMAVDKKGNLLVGTQAGLNRFNVKTGSFSKLMTTSGLIDNWILSIVTDAKDRIWISTRKGISRISSDFKSIKNYNTDDGILSDSFLARSAAKDILGNIYFGSSKGMVWFHPDSIYDNPHMADAAIVGLKINEKYVGVSENSVLKQSIELTNEIVLNRDQSSFSFQLAALNYFNPGKNKIQYKLEGYEEDWQVADVNQVASYSEVSPGTYTFSVRVSNDDEVWNPVQRKLVVKIIRPFWMSWYAIIIYLSVVGGTFYFIRKSITKELNSRTISSELIIQIPIKEEDTADQKFIKKALALINENIGNSEFGVLQLAEKMNCSRAHLYRKVIAMTGVSVSDFIKQTRITKAAQLLLQKTGNISDVAYSVGFDNPGYFSKCFKKQYGVTPANYIVNHLDQQNTDD
ncbi:AraC family transcriptional regulator [Flavobacterium circumlabens]|uniref:AraC family transcriptional regulator n=1 Tax=Flavobacterium circumlabens TaxID=2133765 RepID=UPI00104AF2E8|nr:two-component regulator propeller domain-containing protein [Flavobacterium circumlabens]